jgi:hypothetical protein
MDPLILVERARDAGLRLEVADASLKISGPGKAEPLVRLLAEHKAQVLDALRKVQEVQKVHGTESRGTSTERDPGPCASTLAALRAKCPDYVPEDRWHQAIANAAMFISEWGAQAEAFGWAERELFGPYPVPEQPTANYSRLSRLDGAGLIWLLRGRPVIALTETVAAILAPSGANLTYGRHNKPAPARLGDSVDDISGARA